MFPHRSSTPVRQPTNLPKLFHLIRHMGWRVLDIRRRDALAQFISNSVAGESRIYHSFHLPSGGQQAAKIRADPSLLRRELAHTAIAYKAVTTHFADYDRYCVAWYEDMFDAADIFRADLLDRIASFLGIPSAFDANPRLTKILNENFLEHVENAAEIASLVREQDLTPRESWFQNRFSP